jgi:hypothetical protein
VSERYVTLTHDRGFSLGAGGRIGFGFELPEIVAELPKFSQFAERNVEFRFDQPIPAIV